MVLITHKHSRSCRPQEEQRLHALCRWTLSHWDKDKCDCNFTWARVFQNLHQQLTAVIVFTATWSQQTQVRKSHLFLSSTDPGPRRLRRANCGPILPSLSFCFYSVSGSGKLPNDQRQEQQPIGPCWASVIRALLCLLLPAPPYRPRPGNLSLPFWRARGQRGGTAADGKTLSCSHGWPASLRPPQRATDGDYLVQFDRYHPFPWLDLHFSLCSKGCCCRTSTCITWVINHSGWTIALTGLVINSAFLKVAITTLIKK